MNATELLYRDWLNLDTHLLWCYDEPIDRGRKPQRQFRRDASHVNRGAWLVREGWAKVEHDGQSILAEPGQWLIVKPTRRIQSFAANTHLLSISFDATWPDGRNVLDDGLSVVLDSHECPTLEELAKPMLAMMDTLLPQGWDIRKQRVNMTDYLQLQNHLNTWLLALLTALEPHGISPMGQFDNDNRVVKVIRRINAHPLGEPLDLNAMASAVGLSVVHLNRLFQKDMGCTPTVYFDNLKFERASQELLMPGTRTKDIANELGFTYLSHFSTWFKKRSGKSPREYARGI
jgi:AraC-like DNA-binding protein